MIPEDMTVGSAWRHRNGNAYLIRGFSNVSDSPKYPVMVEYLNYRNGAKYSRRVDDWHRSMTRAPELDRIAPTFFAIRRKRDGMMMPGFAGRAGGTYVNPDKRDTHTGVPRLFTTKKGAAEALRWWANGRVRKEFGYGGTDDIFGGHSCEVTGLQSEKVAGRNADDWEVVSVEVNTKQEETCKT